VAESTLSLSFNDLEAEVGEFLGFGRGALYGDPAWTIKQQQEIAAVRKSGERQFYMTAAFPELGIEAGYEWSFLKPVATLAISSNSQTMPLPDDYAGMEGEIEISASTTITWWSLQVVGVGQVYHQYSVSPTTTGRPLMCCEEPLKGTTGTQGQRYQLRLWPVPDQAYTLKFAYYVNPDAMTSANPYSYGGAEHSETLLESCLAKAEQRLDDAMGIHTALFKERLLASVQMDRRKKPQSLGYNGDRSDRKHRRWPHGDQHGESLVKYKGTQY
jgi:hypothetical protein